MTCKMDKLNLPISKSGMILPKSLSMDDYVKFITLNLRHTIDRKTEREQKKLAVVNTRFYIL